MFAPILSKIVVPYWDVRENKAPILSEMAICHQSKYLWSKVMVDIKLESLETQTAEAAKTLTNIESIVESVDRLGSRTIVCEVYNLTDYPLQYHGEDHSSGGYSSLLPRPVIAPHSADNFILKNTSPFRGVDGLCRYQFLGSTFTCFWVNPLIGGNGSHTEMSPEIPGFRHWSVTGSTNHAKMLFILIQDPPPPPKPHLGPTIAGSGTEKRKIGV